MKRIVTPGEFEVIKRYIRPGDRVFDVGAHWGTWSAAVLLAKPGVELHAFEPAPSNFGTLTEQLDKRWQGQTFLNKIALSDQEGGRDFCFYDDKPGWSTFHRRCEVEKRYEISRPSVVSVSTKTVDAYCRGHDIAAINFMKIDTEGHEAAVLWGAKHLLEQGNINFVQFEYGGTYRDARITLRQIYKMLQAYGYHVFRMSGDRLTRLENWDDAYEDYIYSNFLAVHARSARSAFGLPPRMLDLPVLCRRHGITPRGVIHVGAHDGDEIAVYRSMNVRKVLFIEANPKGLSEASAQIRGCARCDPSGLRSLRLQRDRRAKDHVQRTKQLHSRPEGAQGNLSGDY